MARNSPINPLFLLFFLLFFKPKNFLTQILFKLFLLLPLIYLTIKKRQGNLSSIKLINYATM